MKTYLTATQLSRVSGVSIATIKAMSKRGHIAAPCSQDRYGNDTWLLTRELQDWIDRITSASRNK